MENCRQQSPPAGVASVFQTFNLCVLHNERWTFFVGDGHVLELNALRVLHRQAGGCGGNADILGLSGNPMMIPADLWQVAVRLRMRMLRKTGVVSLMGWAGSSLGADRSTGSLAELFM